MGFILILAAAFAISTGSYFIAISLGNLNFFNVGELISTLKINLFAYGVLLNLIGSFLWANGRVRFTSYVYAWNLYLILLVLFGSLVGYLLNGEKFSMTQAIGIGVVAFGLALISNR